MSIKQSVPVMGPCPGGQTRTFNFLALRCIDVRVLTERVELHLGKVLEASFLIPQQENLEVTVSHLYAQSLIIKSKSNDNKRVQM